MCKKILLIFFFVFSFISCSAGGGAGSGNQITLNDIYSALEVMNTSIADYNLSFKMSENDFSSSLIAESIDNYEEKTQEIDNLIQTNFTSSKFTVKEVSTNSLKEGEDYALLTIVKGVYLKDAFYSFGSDVESMLLVDESGSSYLPLNFYVLYGTKSPEYLTFNEVLNYLQNESMLKVFVENGLDLSNIKSSQGNTLLTYLILQLNERSPTALSSIENLIDVGIDVNVADSADTDGLEHLPELLHPLSNCSPFRSHKHDKSCREHQSRL